MKFYRFRRSTNCERVALALGHKGIAPETVRVDPADRAPVRQVSGQDLVPVLVFDDGEVVSDSMEIVRRLDERHPEAPLYPASASRRAEMLVFIDWFNRVWKRPPNEIAQELEKESPDAGRIERLGTAMVQALDLFERMLDGRDYLMGDGFSAADCCAFPFVKYGALGDGGSTYLFHQVLARHQPIDARHPRLRDWIRRCDAQPRA